MLSYEPDCNGFMQLRVRTTTEGQKGEAETKICYSRALQDLKDLIAATGWDGNAFGEHSGR